MRPSIRGGGIISKNRSLTGSSTPDRCTPGIPDRGRGGANSKNWRATHWVFVALRQIFEHRARIQLPTNRVGWLARQFGPLYPRFFNVRSTNVEERPFVGSSLQN